MVVNNGLIIQWGRNLEGNNVGDNATRISYFPISFTDENLTVIITPIVGSSALTATMDLYLFEGSIPSTYFKVSMFNRNDNNVVTPSFFWFAIGY